MTNATLLLAYLDPGDNGTSGWQVVLYVAVGFLLLLAAIYALTRFVAWAAKR